MVRAEEVVTGGWKIEESKNRKEVNGKNVGSIQKRGGKLKLALERVNKVK